ncbi:MAG TPA: helix-turn-helix transcriptional regulator [Longimicrobiaceae bacterium]|nr:helix-turn-helix transcriptional regulator [Longimicrobiaceae bacterium]
MLHANPVFSARLAQEPQRDRLQQAIDQMIEELSSGSHSQDNGAGLPLVREVRAAKGKYVLRGSYLGAPDPEAGTTVLIALALPEAEPLSEQALQQRFGLTRRESEVARLIVEGKSNLAIATALGISPHTAHHYTERVLLKLGVRSRGEIAAKVLGLAFQNTD